MPWLSNKHREHLMAPLDPLEIKIAFKDMPSGKAPGSDGLTVAFYKAYQEKEADQKRKKAEKDAKRHMTRTLTDKAGELDRIEREQGIMAFDRTHRLNTDKCYPSQTLQEKTTEEDPLMNDFLDKPPIYTPPLYPVLPN
ncbi:hypothetical protein NDU88_006449 [Pleurodeles waltl]|uniref:Uncharacterized protein n=1 Tax=Pleurodeles waltl TaxID=8319 RepID=A0AAV7UQ21_PLEWA|nr:hypothetical protein NDU88_006449 [Pleurodeles waltl]